MLVHEFLLELRRRTKRYLILALDIFLILPSLFLAIAMNSPGGDLPFAALVTLYAATLIVGAAIMVLMRVHFIKLHELETQGLLRILLVAVVTGVAGAVIASLHGYPGFTIAVVFSPALFLLMVGAKLAALHVITTLRHVEHARIPVAIYGAGSAGLQLAVGLKSSSEVCPIAFFDDNPALHRMMISGLPVYAPTHLRKLVRGGRVKRVLIALPSASEARRKEVFDAVAKHDVEIRILPTLADMVVGYAPDGQMKPIEPEHVLGRDSVDLSIPEIAKTYNGRTILVTGAGGSIGSELCRQLLACQTARLVLFDHSEYALYEIERELQGLNNGGRTRIVARLGSVTDRIRVDSLIQEEHVDVILHAAAYKHVSMVEENEISGVHNNVIGTQIVAAAAVKAKVERFILISTDKAVRPTNIMGASKRMAELVVQDLQSRSLHTKLSMVRFGNVLGSSGSVLPTFRQQIAQGGPVTVTHPEVSRYFMTITEASRLVLLAGAYATGGDAFVLDMGKPQRILDIARRMIRLSGNEPKEPGSNKGTVEIQFIGLRPGEKLCEELLIDHTALVSTPHEKIMRAEENCLSEFEVASMLREIATAVSQNDLTRIRAQIVACVDGYHEPNYPQVIQ